jgi:nicotinate phosphoribosyltransferase
MFHTASQEDIKRGDITDVYFKHTLEVLKAKGIKKRVRAEFTVKSLPNGWDWGILAGLEEVAGLLWGLDINVRSMLEGERFFAFQPVMEIEGDYETFGRYETAILGLICQASGVATAAARCKMLAGDRLVLSFGARRVHPTIAPMIERNAYIGGCDGVSVIKSGELIDADPTGTMPHALALLMGDTVAAAKALDETIDPQVKRTVLIDTFNDEKFEAVRVAEALGESLFAVRLDTPASRRGDFYRILEEVRWELDLRGHKTVRLFVSGGITESVIPTLNPVVDGYGIGTGISNAPVMDFSMDIVEIDGEPFAKRGKWSGSKSVLRCSGCGRDLIVPRTLGSWRCSSCDGTKSDLLTPLMESGGIVREMPDAKSIREKVMTDMRSNPSPGAPWCKLTPGG